MVTNSLYTLYAALVSKQVWQLTDQCLNNYGTFPKKPADAIIEGGGGGMPPDPLERQLASSSPSVEVHTMSRHYFQYLA